jgi:hypothetical protein
MNRMMRMMRIFKWYCISRPFYHQLSVTFYTSFFKKIDGFAFQRNGIENGKKADVFYMAPFSLVVVSFSFLVVSVSMSGLYI